MFTLCPLPLTYQAVFTCLLLHRVVGDTLSVCFIDWTGLDEDEDAHVWEDNWDDDNVEDDFSNQLRSTFN